MMATSPEELRSYKKIGQELKAELLRGTYGIGDKLPQSVIYLSTSMSVVQLFVKHLSCLNLRI